MAAKIAVLQPPKPGSGEQHASFGEGGEVVFTRWVLDRLTFPEPDFRVGDRDSVKISFTVMPDGSLNRISSFESTRLIFTCKVLDAIGDSPDWTPATRNGVPVESIETVWFYTRLENRASEDADPVLRAVDEMAYEEADVMPQFEGGGPEKFISWVKTNWHGNEGEFCVIRFIIGRDGSVSGIDVQNWLEGSGTEAFEEFLTGMPRWTLAVLQNEPVNFKAAIPVDLSRSDVFETELLQDDTYCAEMALPVFKGGDLNTFRRWVMLRVVYPEAALLAGISGRVVVAFVIEKDGSVRQIRVESTPDWRLSQAAVFTLQNSPKWTPGKIYGHPIRVSYTLPVDFRLRQ